MPATTNILVPLDGSELAEGAVDVAIDIARPAGGKLTLFVAAEPDAMRALAEYADSEGITSAMATNAYLAQLAARVQAAACRQSRPRVMARTSPRRSSTRRLRREQR